ncbi:threonine synthase [Halalkalicoccus jeotgali]|uniref:Threonine synthase n=1 Tax=Halalkalicoccus jeotgali (strain DSM 18796 / CECT 7217 / JCM 14584 / KCTC 4019 / B3) TaxID=795797 RepID=L9VQJ8_HALJB|nr:threonine synthase [Halalkalicoccus jeotgali]ELY39341.1 threonine synthase [Halalkalicoccus jeotgali B3]
MSTVRCYDCGRSFAFPERKRCECGEPLWFDHGEVAWPDRRDPGMWRYADSLPAAAPAGVGAAAGGTPLVRAPRLDTGGVELYLKDEGQNPTGSFKDRGSALAVASARERGIDRVGTVSHGNMAMSTAACAAGAGLECTVCVPADIPEERLAHIARYGPEILRVEGEYGRLYERSLELEGVDFVNSDTPLRVAGQKTVAYEICEAFASDVPDAIVLPVSSGGQLSGIWKAILELRAAGLIDERPRLYASQASACDPIVRAFGADRREVSPIEGGETIAYSIANADPPSGNRALAALRDTDGGAVSVSDDAIRAAQRRLARKGGFRVEASSAVAYAGLERLLERGEIGAIRDVYKRQGSHSTR